jgi:serine/threonine protein kinase
MTPIPCTAAGRHRDRGESIAEEDVWEATMQLCKGLEYLHSIPVLHRDVKPDNVFIHGGGSFGDGADGELQRRNRDGDEVQQQQQQSPPRVYLLGDLGFGRALGEGERQVQSTVGTPVYQAPELFALPCAYDQKVDLWSLGCVMADAVCEGPLSWAHFWRLYLGHGPRLHASTSNHPQLTAARLRF